MTPNCCTVCDGPLPEKTLEQLQRGGINRLTCSRRCKYQRDRRLRTLARLRRWRERRAAAGDTAIVGQLDLRISQIVQLPYAAHVSAPAVTQSALRTLYQQQQRQLHEQRIAR